ncbi:glycosyltransferase family 4 protein [Apilactobacillus apisilvae]|uniref:Glycosyltransferase family 4 protein n=1 Tax=Apilactobacillus apisilvae TaxID=2923364 RepID=A0ABY4PI99_9LACO|nr:glycosyltransferase family 4 protein [Apilactobacillus apisilvae]UQS85565.1 glycosyltransferase family 4 protein [Apilactobacillus apisilvae]
MLNINMFSTADKVKGQGVGSAYLELIRMLKKHFPNDFNIEINKHSKSDITHYHTINPSYYFSTFFAKRGRKIGYVHFLPETLEGSLHLPKPIKWIFYKYVIAFYKRMDHIVVVNPTFIPKLEKYGIPKSRITYIPNFVSKKEFYPLNNNEKNSIRHKLEYKDSDFIVASTGQVQTRKGVLDFARLAEANPDVKFIWAGGFSFGKITDGYKELKALVDNPPKNLFFPGIVDRDLIFKYYNIADLFLLPSYNELFPMSVLEAFSCGTPVMLRHLDLYKEIIEGYYVPFDNFNDMNYELKKLKNDSKYLSEMSQKSINASKYYSENHLASIWYDFYISQLKEG